MDEDEQLQNVQEAIRLLALAALEPTRFTFELHLLTLDMTSEDRAAAVLVVVGLLSAAEGEKPRLWGSDAHPFLRRFDQHRETLEGVRYERAVAVLAKSLDVHPQVALTLLDSHMSDGKGLGAHQALRS